MTNVKYIKLDYLYDDKYLKVLLLDPLFSNRNNDHNGAQSAAKTYLTGVIIERAKVTSSKCRDSGGCQRNSAFRYTRATYLVETVAKPLNNFPSQQSRAPHRLLRQVSVDVLVWTIAFTAMSNAHGGSRKFPLIDVAALRETTKRQQFYINSFPRRQSSVTWNISR